MDGTYTLKEMLKQEDKNQIITAMMKEIQDHESRDHWTMVPRADMTDGAKTILAVWSFKRKVYPDGRVLKHKGCLFVLMEECRPGEKTICWETYAPVVNWLSVRILFALSVIHNLDIRSIDFVLAFPQSKLDVDVFFMEFPRGFAPEVVPDGDTSKYVLNLNKSLYGLKQATFNWSDSNCAL